MNKLVLKLVPVFVILAVITVFYQNCGNTMKSKLTAESSILNEEFVGGHFVYAALDPSCQLHEGAQRAQCELSERTELAQEETCGGFVFWLMIPQDVSREYATRALVLKAFSKGACTARIQYKNSKDEDVCFVDGMINQKMEPAFLVRDEIESVVMWPSEHVILSNKLSACQILEGATPQLAEVVSKL